MARWLTARGHQASHVSEIGMASAGDDEIWRYADANAAIIVTKDEDFANRRILASSGPVVIWVRLGNARNSARIEWLERGFPFMHEAIVRGETLIEIA